MSRTTRSIPEYVRLWKKSAIECHDPSVARDHYYRNRIIHGRDGATCTEIGSGSRHTPKGYNGWSEVCGGGKAFAKHHAARINRAMGQQRISDALREVDD
jgi:hypothetical protein